MLNKEVKAVYEALADAYDATIDEKPHNAYYDRPNTLALLPELAGLHVLDAACGPGKYAEIMLARGATVTGFDLSPRMVELARLRNPSRGTFFEHDLSEPLPFLADGTFDVVLCALALHYIADMNPTIREFHRLLQPGGQLVVSTGHPFAEFTDFATGNYFATEAVSCWWSSYEVEMPSYRSSLTTLCAAFTDNGFYLDRIVEPLPTEEFRAAYPERYEALQAFPAFICIRAVRND